MQEIITKTRPEVIIETGTAKGGTTLFYATILEQLKGGRIITVDIDDHDPRSRSLRRGKNGFSLSKGVQAPPRCSIKSKLRSRVAG